MRTKRQAESDDVMPLVAAPVEPCQWFDEPESVERAAEERRGRISEVAAILNTFRFVWIVEHTRASRTIGWPLKMLFRNVSQGHSRV